MRRAPHGRVRSADRPRRSARLPAARLGRRSLSQLRPRLCRRLLHRLPGERGDGGQRPARDRPDLSLRAAARVRGAADAGADPHGGRERRQALAVSRFHGGRQALGRTDRQRRARAVRRATGLSPRRSPDLRPAQERARVLARSRRLHRGRGDRRRSLRLLPFDRPQSEAALRPDGGFPVRDRPDRSRRAFRRCRAAGAERRVAHRRERRGAVQVARHVRRLLPRGRQDARDDDGRRLRQDGRRRLLRSGRPAQDHRPRQGRRPPQQRADVRSQVHREQAEVLPRDPRGGGVRRRSGFRRGDDQYRAGFGRQLGRAQRHRLRVLSGARRQRPSLRHDREARRRGQSRAEPRAGHGWRADQALLDSAQGARPGRRRSDPHAKGQARRSSPSAMLR